MLSPQRLHSVPPSPKHKIFLYGSFRFFCPQFLKVNVKRKFFVLVLCSYLTELVLTTDDKKEVVLFFNTKHNVILDFSSVPSAFASGITARATRAYILGVCIVCFANCTPQVGGRKESFPQLRAPPRSCNTTSSMLFRFLLSPKLTARFNVPTESTLAQPPSSFSSLIM